jgi:hypothetical protein
MRVKINLAIPRIRRRTHPKLDSDINIYSVRGKDGKYSDTAFGKWLENFEIEIAGKKTKNNHPVEVANYLRQNGLPVEHFLFSKGRHVLAKNAGTPLHDVINSDRSRAQDLKIKAAKLLGRVHALGVVHGDAVLGNFTVTDNVVHLIDFETALKVRPNWAEFYGLEDLFYDDIKSFIGDQTIKEAEKSELLDTIIGQYPIDAEQKRALAGRIMRRINRK